ncbi:uncharacterized protein LOC118436191 [Folsomia candida]|uniref:Translation initiation factor IF-2 n=1 Tax=Folsomia candida TaxID=158441 RepID=A0A226E3U6_FOLCA|nr:uncharacterized protein LOC118436191 [Folsomia candida]OXA51694.1 Translation initiation factor IF-2 [Folsomia candida]
MLVHVLCHLFVHLSLLHVVFAARASSVADWNEQNQLSSSDDPPNDDWIDHSSSPAVGVKYPKRYPSLGLTHHNNYYADSPTDVVRHPPKLYNVPQRNVGTGRPYLLEAQKELRPSSHVFQQTNQLYGPTPGQQSIGHFGGGSLSRPSIWGQHPDNNESKLGWGWTSGAGAMQHQQYNRLRDGGRVNYAAVSLLGLLALMGTIQHVMADLENSMPPPAPGDGEMAMSISGNRPRPPPRPLRPTMRPSGGGATPSRPKPGNNMSPPTSAPMMSTSSKMPSRLRLKYKNHTFS